MTLPGNRKLVCVGSYRLTGRRLGKGNFAKVEEAVHTVLKTKVALKIMNISEIKEEYVIRNLHREARLMSQLSHPCIATLFETMQNGPVYYLVTELVGGGDLCSYIKSQRGGKLEERPTKIFGRQLVSAVAYMHNMGIVHRDLKMENIMLNESRTHLKIVDFGLSNNWSPDSPLRTHCGSPEYAAPELFVTGQLYGPQVDLWSLGVILYGMVLGQLPFLTSRDSRISSQDRRKHLLMQINRGLAPVHRKALAAFTIEFRAMLARLLMPDPVQRIRVIELVRHPWLTDRNRRPLRITGLDDIEPAWKAILLKEVGKLVHMEPSHVVAGIRADRFGGIGGMYNLLVYKRSMQVELSSKESLTTTTQATRPATTVCTGTTATHHVARFKAANRPVTAITCPRQQPNTAQTVTPPKPEVRKNKEWNNDIQGTPSRLRVIGTRNINKTYSLRSSANAKPAAQTAARVQNTTPVVKSPQNSLVNRRTKSEPIPQPQPHKPVAPGGRTAERAAKRKSERPGRTSGRKSAPTTSTRSGTTRASSNHQHSANTTVHALKQRTPSQAAPTRASGTSSSGEPQINRRLLNEPIARCIAGYVGKYMNVHGAKRNQTLVTKRASISGTGSNTGSNGVRGRVHSHAATDTTTQINDMRHGHAQGGGGTDWAGSAPSQVLLMKRPLITGGCHLLTDETTKSNTSHLLHKYQYQYK